VLAWAVCAFMPLAAVDEPTSSFEGEWRTTIAILKLEQKGESVTGSYGPGGRFTLKGTVKGNILTVMDWRSGFADSNPSRLCSSTLSLFLC